MKPRISGPYPVLNKQGKIPQRYLDENSSHANYDQNDETQPDYIKNRPFYVETITLVDGELTPVWEDGYVGYAHISAEKLANLNVTTSIPVSVELNDNGKVYTEKGYFDGRGILDANACDFLLGDSLISEPTLDGTTLILNAGGRSEFDNVTIKITTKNIKTIDEKFLPSTCGVQYIYSDGGVFGSTGIDALATGAYLLHGVFWSAGFRYAISYFDDAPTLVNVYNNGSNVVKLTWTEQSADFATVLRMLIVRNYEIVLDESYNIDKMYALGDETANALSLAQEANAQSNNALQTANDALQAASYAVDGFRLHEQIIMKGADNNFYIITVDANGELKAEIFE